MRRVLIVDDNMENRYLLRALLQGNGLEVDEALHGGLALEHARANPPDMVISDLLMPVVDGYVLLRQWKADERLKAIPFVVYTATFTDPRDERLALALGADAFLVKPSEPEPFMALIREVLERNDRGELHSTVERPMDDTELLNDYNEVLVRKLEKKAHELEQTNRELVDEIAERRRTEAALRQSQKMEAVGRLAGGVAHDFNNLLTIICGYGHLLLERPDLSDVVRESVEVISDAGERAAVLTRQLLAFSRQTMLQPKILNPNAVVDDTAKMLRRLIGEDIKVTTVLGAGSSRVKADPGQLEQVLMNLAVNARDAMPMGGTLTIETADVVVGDDDAPTHLGCASGPHVLLTIRDTGCGMTPDILAHVFEPFFTTKEVGQGTGLGLAMVFGIVQQSGGCIHVDSEPGQGTVFEIFVPAVAGAVAEMPPSKMPVGVDGTETVLLVEDEEGVRGLALVSLQTHGYRVVTATDGHDALRVVASHEGPVDVVVTDVVMPKLGGPELAEQVRALYPNVKVLFMSGYADDAVVRHGLLMGDVDFIQKPFTPLGLAMKVRQILDAARPSDETPEQP